MKRKGGYKTKCNDCRKEIKKYYDNNCEDIKEKVNEYQQNNPEKRAETRKKEKCDLHQKTHCIICNISITVKHRIIGRMRKIHYKREMEWNVDKWEEYLDAYGYAARADAVLYNYNFYYNPCVRNMPKWQSTNSKYNNRTKLFY